MEGPREPMTSSYRDLGAVAQGSQIHLQAELCLGLAV